MKKLIKNILLICITIVTFSMFGCDKNDDIIEETIINEETNFSIPEDYYKSKLNYDEFYEKYTVKLGLYEQDANHANGLESIEWLILDEIDGKLLLLSKNILDDASGYNYTDPVKYFDDLMKKVLKIMQGEINRYISVMPKQIAIEGDEYIFLENLTSGEFFDYSKNNKVDYIFNLSKKEVEKYFGTMDINGMNLKAAAKGTDYLKYKKGFVGKKESEYKDNGTYYLRDIADDEDGYKYVGIYGHIYDNSPIDDDWFEIGIRPAMWIEKSDLNAYIYGDENEEKNDKRDIMYDVEEKHQIDSESEKRLVRFGYYEQDGNLENNTEIVDWQVLDEKDDCYLLISKYILDVFKINNIGNIEDIQNKINKMLEDNNVFTKEEKLNIYNVSIKSYNNVMIYMRDAADIGFLLNEEEINKYFNGKENKKAKATRYAINKGLNDYNEYVDYLVRNESDISYISRYGYLANEEKNTSGVEYVGIRPCIYIKKDFIDKYDKIFKKNDNIIANSFIYYDGFVYGTNEKGMINREGISYDAKMNAYLNDEIGKPIFTVGEVKFRKKSYFLNDNYTVCQEDEYLDKRFNKTIYFNKDKTISKIIDNMKGEDIKNNEKKECVIKRQAERNVNIYAYDKNGKQLESKTHKVTEYKKNFIIIDGDAYIISNKKGSALFHDCFVKFSQVPSKYYYVNMDGVVVKNKTIDKYTFDKEGLLVNFEGEPTKADSEYIKYILLTE